MAQVANQNKDDETQFSTQNGSQQQGGSDTSTQQPPTTYSSGGATQSGGGSSAPTSSAAPSAPSGSQGQQAYTQAASFHNIGALLNANQGKGQQIAQQATSTAGDLANSAQQAVKQGYTQYQNDVKAATPTGQNYSTSTTAVAPTTATPTGNATTDAFTSHATTASNAPQQLSAPATFGTGANTPSTGPVGASSIFNNLKSFLGSAAASNANNANPTANLPSATDPALVAQAGQTYTGPSSLANDTNVDNSAIANKVAAAQDANNTLGLQGGVASSLGETGGIGALDELLARQGGGAQALNNQASRFQGINNQLNNGVGGFTDTSAADAAKAQVAQQAANANAAITARTQNATTAQANANAAVKAKQDQADQNSASYQNWVKNLKGMGVQGISSLGNFGGGYFTLPPGVALNITGTYSPSDMQKIYDYNVQQGRIDPATGNIKAGYKPTNSF